MIIPPLLKLQNYHQGSGGVSNGHCSNGVGDKATKISLPRRGSRSSKQSQQQPRKAFFHAKFSENERGISLEIGKFVALISISGQQTIIINRHISVWERRSCCSWYFLFSRIWEYCIQGQKRSLLTLSGGQKGLHCCIIMSFWYSPSFGICFDVSCVSLDSRRARVLDQIKKRLTLGRVTSK